MNSDQIKFRRKQWRPGDTWTPTNISKKSTVGLVGSSCRGKLQSHFRVSKAIKTHQSQNSKSYESPLWKSPPCKTVPWETLHITCLLLRSLLLLCWAQAATICVFPNKSLEWGLSCSVTLWLFTARIASPSEPQHFPWGNLSPQYCTSTLVMNHEGQHRNCLLPDLKSKQHSLVICEGGVWQRF